MMTGGGGATNCSGGRGLGVPQLEEEAGEELQRSSWRCKGARRRRGEVAAAGSGEAGVVALAIGRGRCAGLCSSLCVAARVTGSRASGAMGGKVWAQEEGRVRGARGGSEAEEEARKRRSLGTGRRPLPEAGRPARGGWRRGDRAGSARCVRVCAAAGGDRRGERGSGQSMVRARVRKLVRAAGP